MKQFSLFVNGKQLLSTVLILVLTKKPIGVRLASQNCDIEEASNYLQVRTLDGNAKESLGLCSDTIYNFKDEDAGPLIEFIEMHILLGVDQIYVYDFHNVSDGIRKILEYYSSKGVIVIVPWKVPVKVFYKDQFFRVREGKTFCLMSKNMLNTWHTWTVYIQI